MAHCTEKADGAPSVRPSTSGRTARLGGEPKPVEWSAAVSGKPNSASTNSPHRIEPWELTFTYTCTR
jgi:hypothetical protein